MQYLNLTLLLFEALSGLHINKLKSIIYPVNNVLNIDELAGTIGCNIGTLPSTYLGLPLGAKFKSCEIWNGAVEKFEKRLTSWQLQYLSLGGRVTLISSVLDSIPTYFMSLFPIPSKVLEKLDKIRKDFLWEGNSNSKKYHLIAWDKVLKPKYEGGLGVRDLSAHNKSLLMKWLWRYGTEEPSLWKEVINSIHGAKDNWSTRIYNAPYGVGLWKYISKLRDEFFQKVHFKPGNREHIKFWEDKWLGNNTLKEEYPGLFNMALDKVSSIAQNRSNNSWDVHFRIYPQDWEIQDLLELLAKVETSSIDASTSDRMRWGSKGNFSVKDCYSQLGNQDQVIDSWPWKLIWRTKLPTKIKCFSWIALNNASLTIDNLNRKGLQLDNKCLFCNCQLETVNHLFLHCPVAFNLWTLFFTIFGLSWVMPQNLREAYVSWSKWKVDKAIKKTWLMIPAAIFLEPLE